jgi:chromosome segregation ATPase
MSTANASGEISEGKALSYDAVVKQFGALESRLDGIMSIIKEVNTKLEQQDMARKKAALLAQKIAARRASLMSEEEEAKHKEEEAKKKEEEDAKRKKLEELKSRLSEVKTKVEEGKKVREASAAPAGKGAVGAVKEENADPYAALFGQSPEMPKEFQEILGASRKFQELGLLSG